MFNIFLFVPFGIIVSLHFPSRFRKKLWPIVATLLLACLLSCFIEFAQLFVRNRHSSLTDIISNTTGGLAGGLIVRFWPGSFGGYLASLIGWKWAWSAILALTLLLAWAPASIPVVFPNWYLPGLWATDATLNAGNNPSLTRPWYGSLHRVAIYSQALDPEHARECFWTMKDGKPASPQADDKLEALYEFDESHATALLDRSGRGSDLHLEGTGRFRWRPKHGGVQLRHPARLSTGRVSGKRISTS
ncbi:MAG: VanZ family protein, partial [Acidobacteria bacterium]